jgi:Big-like domain-containing protein
MGLVLALGVPASAQAACYTSRFSFFPGMNTSAMMQAPSGKSCGAIVHAAGQSRFDSVRVTVPPANGTAVSRQGVGVTYRSKPGFKGQDSFTFTVTGRMRRGEGTATIRMNVTVN